MWSVASTFELCPLALLPEAHGPGVAPESLSGDLGITWRCQPASTLTRREGVPSQGLRRVHPVAEKARCQGDRRWGGLRGRAGQGWRWLPWFLVILHGPNHSSCPGFWGIARFLRTHVLLCLSECRLGSVASNPQFPEAEEVKRGSLATRRMRLLTVGKAHWGLIRVQL